MPISSQLRRVHVRRVVGPEELRVDENEGHLDALDGLQPVERLLRRVQEDELAQLLEAEQAPREADPLPVLDLDLAVGPSCVPSCLPQEIQELRPVQDPGGGGQRRLVSGLQRPQLGDRVRHVEVPLLGIESHHLGLLELQPLGDGVQPRRRGRRRRPGRRRGS